MGQQTTPHQLFLLKKKKKSHRNTASMPICFYIVSGSFHSIRLGVSSCIRDHMATQAKLFGMWSFPINVCQFLFYHTCSTTSFSTLSEAEIKTVNSSSIQLFTYKYHLYFYYPTLEDRYTHTHMLQTEVQTLHSFQTLPFCLNQYLEIFKSYFDYVIDVYNRHIPFFSLCNLLIFLGSRLLGCVQVPNNINLKFV